MSPASIFAWSRHWRPLHLRICLLSERTGNLRILDEDSSAHLRRRLPDFHVPNHKRIFDAPHARLVVTDETSCVQCCSPTDPIRLKRRSSSVEMGTHMRERPGAADLVFFIQAPHSRPRGTELPAAANESGETRAPDRRPEKRAEFFQAIYPRLAAIRQPLVNRLPTGSDTCTSASVGRAPPAMWCPERGMSLLSASTPWLLALRRYCYTTKRDLQDATRDTSTRV